MEGADGNKIDHITMRYEWLFLGDNLDPSNTTSWSDFPCLFFVSLNDDPSLAVHMGVVAERVGTDAAKCM